jgi:hypothetical protein
MEAVELPVAVGLLQVDGVALGVGLVGDLGGEVRLEPVEDLPLDRDRHRRRQ